MCNPSSHLRPFIHSFHFVSFRFISFRLFSFSCSFQFVSCHVISFRFVRSFVHAFLAFSRRISCACCSPWKCAECVVPFVSTPPFHSLLFPFRFKSSLSFVTFFLSFQLLYPIRYCFPLFQIIRQFETLSSGQGVIKLTSSRSLCRSSHCHGVTMLRRCGGLLASRLRVLGMKSSRPSCAQNASQHEIHTHICIYVYMYSVYMYMCIYIYVCMYIFFCKCLYICICVYMYMSIYVYMHICTHVYVHIVYACI
jgi:hypothetical protein